jgi:hypothetical protein
MFNRGKKDEEEDPQKALDHGKEVLNKGFTGAATKLFMGQGFVDKMNKTMDKGQEAIDMQGQWMAQAGLDATAVVVAIEDTGRLINMNPVVKLTLKVQPLMGTPAFDTVGESIVSKIAIPRKGDTIKIKYNPADPSKFTVSS